MRNRLTALFAMLLFVLFGATTVMAQTTYYVDPSGTDGSGYGTGTGTSAFKTISYALTQVSSTVTDVIHVAAGTYSESLTMGNSVTILGPNENIAGNGTRNSEANLEGNVLVNSDNVTIKGLLIDGTNVTQTGLSQRGILVGNVNSQSNPTIKNNIIKNWVTGISLAGGSTFPWNEDVVIEGNKFINAGIGSTENVDDLTIINNSFDNGGIGLGGGCVLAAPISGNDFSNGSSRYIGVASGVSLTFLALLTDNTFDKAVACDNATGQWYEKAVFTTISGAVAVAASGATLTVASGTYTENLSISAGLTLKSAYASGSSTGAPVVTGTVTVAADNVTIKAIKLTNPSGSYCITSNGNSYLTIEDNHFNDVGSSSSGATHVIAVTSALTTPSTDITDIVVKDNVFSAIHGGTDGSGSAISIGWSNSNFKVDNLIIDGNDISDVNANTNSYSTGGRGAYGILINVGSGGNGGEAPAAQIKNNTISDLEGLWSHAIGLEGDTPNAVVEGNSINDVTDHKTPSDAIGVLFEKNKNAHTVTIENNHFGPDLPFGVALHPDYFDPVKNNSTAFWHLDLSTYDIDATGNYWNEASGPDHSTNTSGTGTPVGDEVTYAPWLAVVPGTTPMTWGTNGSIPDAISIVNAGDIIKMAPGDYSTTTTIAVNKSVTIDGQSSSEASVIGTAATAVPVFGVSADNVTIQNLDITLTESALESYGQQYDGMIQVSDNAATGLSVLSNRIWVPLQDGPMSSWGVFAVKIGRNNSATVTGNTIYNQRQGVSASYGATLVATNNTIYHTKGGILNYTNDLTQDADRTITGNTWDAPDPTMSHNEWDIVWHSGGSYPDPFPTSHYDNVLTLSATNNNAYVVDNRGPGTQKASGGNRSHAFVLPTGNTVLDHGNGNMNDPLATVSLAQQAIVSGGTILLGDNISSTAPTYSFDTNDNSTNDITFDFTVLPELGGQLYVDVSTTPPAGAPSLPTGSSSLLYVEITSDMTNYSFSVDVTLDLNDLGLTIQPTVAPIVMYFNTVTGKWMILEGTYNSGNQTYSFTTNHFTTFAFVDGNVTPNDYHNDAASAYDLYVTSDPTVAAGSTIYPNDSWALPTPLPDGYGVDVNDWGYTGDESVALYVVPVTTAEFGSSDIILQWTDGTLGTASSGVDYTGSIYESASSTNPNTFATWETLGTTNSVRLNASLMGSNFDGTLSTGDYIAKINLELLKPGSSQIAFIGADLRHFESNTAPTFVWSQSNDASIKAYLGDVASSSSESTGDGAIDINDLTPWALSYWSGVPGGTGMTYYKVKYDIGPTANNYVDGLPTVDGQIDFEDLMIFAINYGLSANNSLPRTAPTPDGINLNVTDATYANGITTVTLGAIDNPVDLKGLSLTLNGHFGDLISAEYAGNRQDVVVFHRRDGNQLMVDMAALGADNAISRSGALITLRFAGDADVAQLSGLARDSRNNPIRINRFAAPVAGSIALDQNYPNPFNPVTNIRYTVEESATVRLDVFNVLGSHVATLVNATVDAGTHTVQWNGRDTHGRQQPSGMYIYRLTAGKTVVQKTMVLSK